MRHGGKLEGDRLRITVISDSHGQTRILRRILDDRSDSDHIFFLGDKVSDLDGIPAQYPRKTFYTVSGNCDYFSLQPSSDIARVADTPIFFTHGHTLGVKHGTENLIRTAKAANCKIALYGHTHIPQTVYEDGLYIVNPGSCAEPRSGGATYAVIDIEPGGILPIIINL